MDTRSRLALKRSACRCECVSGVRAVGMLLYMHVAHRAAVMRSLEKFERYFPFFPTRCYVLCDARVWWADLLQEVTLLLPSRKVDTELCREETVRCGHMRINGKVGGRLIY